MLFEILTSVAVVVGLINLVLNIMILRKVKFNEFRIQNQMGQGNQTEGVVFCRKCNQRYPASLQKCPMCGEVRR